IEEILQEQTSIKVETRALPKEEVIAQQSLILLETDAPLIPELEKAKVTELLENFVMSVSAMNAYMRCPLSFHYEYVLRIPSVPNEAATYGTAIHNALRRLFDKMLADPEKAFPEVEEFVLDFASEMKRRRHYFSKSGYARRMRMGKKNLTLYYQQHIKKWSKTVMPEMDVRNVELQGVPMKGALDKVVIQDKQTVKIVDYKTGSLSDKKMKPPTKKDLEGGIYWRQLYFYKILFEQYRNQTRRVGSAEIAYLETDRDKNFPTSVMMFNDEHELLVKQMIVETYQKIKAHDFYEGCGKDTCKWCNFARRNIMVDSFTDEDAGDLDD
ncbi:MAG: PD-(D/E)XK nuclease family protein, partial [Saprospiraceae bacterium]